MNHMRNIKEMLSIPTGSRNVATSGYSSFTDSQLFFGSQFWPENSQSASQDMSLSSRTSQQSSQELSDPKISNSYHTKPLLFGEFKDKSKAFGMLDKFEEDKKRAKEKTDSDILAKECHHFRETLNNIQQLVAGTERNTAVCQTVIEKFDNFASTFQNNLNSLQRDISQQFETLLNKVNSQNEMMAELEERMQKNGDTTAELGSNLQILKTSLECLREEQERERNMLEEALKLLNALVSEHSGSEKSQQCNFFKKVMDSAVQTSPGLGKPSSNILRNKLEGTQLTCMSNNLEHNQAEVPPRDPSCIIGQRKFTVRGHRRHKKRPLVLSQRRKRSVTDENRQPLINCNKQPLCECSEPSTVTSQDSPNPDCLMPLNRETRSAAAGCFITPLSCWSQDSNSSVCVVGIEPILEKLSSEPKTGTSGKHKDLWQLFDTNNDSDLGF